MKDVLFIDSETHPFSVGNMAPRIVCVSWCDGPYSRVLSRHDARPKIEWALKRTVAGELVIVAHNTAYDMACVLSTWSELGPLVWEAYANGGIACTYAREKLLDIAEDKLGREGRQYNLEDLTRRHLGVELDKAGGWRLRYGELDGTPIHDWPKDAYDYAQDDARYGYDLYRHQEDRARQLHYDMPTEFDEARAAFALQLMSVWGIRTDAERVNRMWDSTGRRMLELSTALVDGGVMRAKNGKTLPLFGGEGKIGIGKKDMAAIRGRIEKSWPTGLGPVPRTDKKSIKTAAEVIEMCDDPVLDALVEFNSLQKSGSTYIRKLFDGIVAPIHASFDAIGAASDRTTCRNPNLQNQPTLPGVRECFVPRPDCVFLACDFDSQEMRTLAQSCLDITGRSKLAERYQTDVSYDPHHELGDAHGFTRQHAKIANFGLPGGMGVKGLIRYAKKRGAVWDKAYAGRVRASWLEQWPEMITYFDHIRSVIGEADYGRVIIPQSGFRREGCGYTDASNTYFQTLAAHASKAALFEVVRRCYDETLRSPLLASRPVAFIHDEIILETPEEAGHEAAVETERVMVDAMHGYTPGVPPSASATLMKRWSKGAKRIVKQGRLVPWE